MAEALPWWLSAGEEECPQCGEFYALELEFRCPDCDEPLCPHCRIRHTAVHFVCPSCVTEPPRRRRTRG
jgi:hypothetical protein